MNYLLLLVGIAVLTAGGEALIRGSLAAASRLGVSPLLSGLVIVGFGTSAPEFVVSVDAAITARPDIAVGNVVGSNIGNVLLILGVCALIRPLSVRPTALRRDAVTALVASLIFLILASDTAFEWVDGMVTLTAIAAYLGGAYWSERTHGGPAAELHGEEAKAISAVPKSGVGVAASVVGGLLLLIVGSRVLLAGAVGIASDLGLSEAVIGLVFVAVGTSLPEFTVSVIATLRRHADVAVGNVLGSNIFNLLFILGVSALLQPLPVHERILIFDQWVMFGTSLLLLVFLHTGTRLKRWEGGVFLACYAGYVGLSFLVFAD